MMFGKRNRNHVRKTNEKRHLLAGLAAILLAVFMLTGQMLIVPQAAFAEEGDPSEQIEAVVSEEETAESNLLQDDQLNETEDSYVFEEDAPDENTGNEEPVFNEDQIPVSDVNDDAEKEDYTEEIREEDSLEQETEEDNSDEDKDAAPALLTLEEMAAVPDTSAEATIQSCDEVLAVKGDRKWTANIFYVNQKDPHFVEKKENFNLKYQVEFRSAANYSAYDVELRLPLYLFKFSDEKNKDTGYEPAKIGVPKGEYDRKKDTYVSESTDKSVFNYYIDTEKEEIVFFNYAPIEAGTVNAWQVLYSDIDTLKADPEIKWSFVPEISVKNGEEEEHLEKDEVLPLGGTINVSADQETQKEQAEEDAPKSVEELKNVDEDIAEAVKVVRSGSDEKKKPKRTAKNALRGAVDPENRSWTYSIYYVGQPDSYHVEKYDDFKLKYQMEFHNSVDIEQYGVQIRIPASLVLYGHDGENIQKLPDDIAVPKGSYDKETGEYTWTAARKSDFNYYLDEETNELVFFNYQKIEAGSDNAWQILYRNYDAMQIEDEFTWSVKPDVSVLVNGEIETPTEDEITPLSGHVNTRVELQTVYKDTLNDFKSYNPSIYTQKQLLKYAPNAASIVIPGTDGELLTEHFDDYYYIVWTVNMRGAANQPYDLVLWDWLRTQDNKEIGFIVGAYEGSAALPKETIAREEFMIEGQDLDSGSVVSIPEDAGGFRVASKASSKTMNRTIRVVSAFPKTEVEPNKTVIYNTAKVSMIPYDRVDNKQNLHDSEHWTYVDYKWRYSGDIIGVQKSGSPDELNSWTTVYGLIDGDTDLRTSSFSVDGTCRSFALTHFLNSTVGTMGSYMPGTFAKVTTVDDAVYAYPLDGSKAGNIYFLTKDDYYFNSVKVSIVDTGYDVFEDETSTPEPVSATTGIDRDVHVYAMFALDEEGNPTEGDKWEEVGTAPWKESGQTSYTFTAAQIAREPYRVKMEHNAVDYESHSYINLNISIRGDSPAFADFPDAKTVKLENICGIMGEYFTTDENGEHISHGYFQDTSTEDRYKEEGLLDFTTDLYETVLMRDSKLVTLLGEKMHAHAAKSAKNNTAYNDPENGRVTVRYMMEASEGYKLFSAEAIDYLKEAEDFTSPNRKEVVFYDLLPFGVQFDPSGSVVAGRIRSASNTNDVSKEGTWDKTQVEVTVDPDTDVILNYHGTGRTLVKFHVKYTGRDSSQYANGEWFSGYGVAFDAYVDYEDYTSADERPNIVAFMPENGDDSPLLGTNSEVSLDDGQVVSSDGFREYYKELGADINDDGITTTRNVLYASAKVFSDIAISAPAGIRKYVRADDDPFGVYKKSTAVLSNQGYEYKLTVTAGNHDLTNIVIFDRLENSIEDRQEQEPGAFEETCWHGTFDDVIISEVLVLDPKAEVTVYYNADRNAALPATGEGDPLSYLTEENGWFKASDWALGKEEVRAVAFDLGSFVLEEEGSVSVRIHMNAPDEVTDATWAYNNPGFCALEDATGMHQTVYANSVKVRWAESKGLELEKQLDENVPAGHKYNNFQFYLTWNDGENKTPYSYRKYTLYQKDETGDWIELAGLHSTDAEGSLTLTAGQKAFFEELDAENIEIREKESLYWTLKDGHMTDEVDETTGVRLVTAVNEYHPILYVQKNVRGYNQSDIQSVNLQPFRMQLKDGNGLPVANREFYVVRQAMLNGRDPVIINAEHKLYGNLGTPAELPEGIRILKTDENGIFEIYPEETVAIPLVTIGETYTVTELEESYSIESDWMCDTPSVSGQVNENGALLKIANQYRWKNLEIRKTIQDSGSADLSKEIFTFRIYSSDPETEEKGSIVTDYKWRVEDSSGKVYDPQTGEPIEPDEENDLWNSPDENGQIKAVCSGKRIVVSRFKAGTAVVVEEVLNEELSDRYTTQDDEIFVQIPMYAAAGYADIINKYLYRDLTVTKTAVSSDLSADLSALEFTMILEVSSEKDEEGNPVFVPAANKEYRLFRTDNGEEILPASSDEGDNPDDEETQEVTHFITDESGRFIIHGNSYAVFSALDKVGHEYRIREVVSEDYLPISPMPDESGEYSEYINGVFGDENKASFVNGSTGILVLKKHWVADDEDAQAYLDQQSYLPVTLEADVDGYALEVIASQNASWNTVWNPEKDYYDYYATFYSGDGYIVYQFVPDPSRKDSIEEVEYTVWETYGSNPYSTIKNSSDPYMQNSSNSIILGYGSSQGKTFTINGGQSLIIKEGTAGSDPSITFENHLRSNGSMIQKRKVGTPVPAGASLVWRVEQFTDGTWKPAENVNYSIGSISVAQNYYVYDYGNYTNTYYNSIVPAGVPVYSTGGATGKDGLITIVNDEEFGTTGSAMNYLYDNGNYTYQQWVAYSDVLYVAFDRNVYVNRLDSEAKEGDYRVVEVPSMTDEEWGTLSSYTTTDLMSNVPNSFLYSSTSPYATSETATGFINSNNKTRLKIEKVTDEPTSQVFKFKLEKYLNILESQLEPGAGYPYKVYDKETGELIKEGVTSSSGEFSLLSGQYAEIEVPTGCRWRVSELDSLPYHVVKIEAEDGTAIEGVSSIDIYNGGDIEEIVKSDMVVHDVRGAIDNLIRKSGYSGNYQGVKNVIFGTPDQYPDVISDTFEIMDVYQRGTIKGYIAQNEQGGYDVYILSDNPMYLNTDCSNTFNGMYYLNSVTFDNIASSKTKNMDYMFGGCQGLSKLDLSSFDTSNVLSMAGMFSGCYNLKDLNVSSFDTSDVYTMANMFEYCNSLQELNISSFDTEKAVNQNKMFEGCYSLNKIQLGSNFTFTAVNGDAYLPNITATGGGVRPWVREDEQFGPYKPVDLTKEYTSEMAGTWVLSDDETKAYAVLTEEGDMTFFRSDSIDEVTAHEIMTVTDIKGNSYTGYVFADIETYNNGTPEWFPMYSDYPVIRSARVAEGQTISPYTTENWFFYGTLTEYDGTGMDTSRTYNMASMFYHCVDLQRVDISAFNMNNVSNTYNMFYDCAFREITLGKENQLNNVQLPSYSRWKRVDSEDEPITASELSYTYNPDMAGTWVCTDNEYAYAVLQSDGELILFRSEEIYTNNTTQTVTDIKGNTYEGIVFTGIESTYYSPWSNQNSYIKSVRVADDQIIRPISTDNWFSNCYNMTSFNGTGLDTSKVQSMNYMFYECRELQELDLSMLDTSALTSMDGMFSYCNNLNTIEFGDWNTSNLTSLRYVFNYCNSLESLDLSVWDTSNITDMAGLFNGCSSLKDLDSIAGWDTSKVQIMQNMFSNCSSLEDIDLSDWDVALVYDMSYMFSSCSSLESLDLTSWDTGWLMNASGMFQYCNSLEELDLSGWNTERTNNMSYMFSNCANLESLNISSFTAASYPNTYYMFSNSSKLCEITLGRGMFFNNTPNLNQISFWERTDGGYEKVSGAQLTNNYNDDMAGTWVWSDDNYAYAVLTNDGDLIFFRSTESYPTLISNTTVTDIKGNIYTGMVFSGFEANSSKQYPPWNNYRNNIKRAYVAPGQKISPLNTYDWFYYCSNLTFFDGSGFDMSNATDASYMFYYCTSLQNAVNLSGWDTSSITSVYFMFYDCYRLQNLDLSGWDTSAVTQMYGTFEYCSALQSIDLSGWNLSSVYNTSYMFYYCNNLRHIYITDSWNTDNVTSHTYMFTNDTYLPHYSSSYTNKTRAYAGNPYGYLEKRGKVTVISSDESLGTVSGSIEGETNTTLVATPSSGASFVGWYKDGQLLSNANNYSYYCDTTEPVTIEGRFTN